MFEILSQFLNITKYPNIYIKSSKNQKAKIDALKINKY